MRSLLAVILATLLLSAGASSANSAKRMHSPASKDLPETIIFSASKGDVSFNHPLHLEAMKAEGCVPCHQTKTPKKGDIKTRFDERIAHYFCRGCHRDKGQGPTECHQCHKKN